MPYLLHSLSFIYLFFQTWIILDVQFIQLKVWPWEDLDEKKWPSLGIVGQARPPKPNIIANICVVCNYELE